MSKIRILPDQLANRIAAGEVVERPASVVKELIENCIDAHADRIDIEIEGGGTRLIRIKDNGIGMDEDDVLLCFERHGTSKITNDQDLDSIVTLGFRGEALPSIASVARIRLSSRTQNQELGTLVDIDYGKLLKVHETGCSQGTLIEVQNLFAKTPARRKFLKTKRTEISHIDEIVKNYALACPALGFSLMIDGKTTIFFNQAHTLEERLRTIFAYSEDFIPVTAHNEQQQRKLHGLLIPPEKVLSGTGRMRLFINGRAIKDRLMHHAVMEGLHGFLLKGHTPSGYLHLHLPPDEVDVNVHPAKQEVRFRNTTDMHQFIKLAVEAAMKTYQNTIRQDFLPRKQQELQHSTEAASVTTSEANGIQLGEEISSYTSSSGKRDSKDQGKEPQPLPFTSTLNSPLQNRENIVPDMKRYSSLPFSQSLQQRSSAPPLSVEAPLQKEHKEPQATPPAPPHPPQLQSEPLTEQQPQRVTTHGMHIIGQFSNLYIFCQNDDNLFVIDQHAAHERLLFEKLYAHYLHGTIAKQTLLFPATVELSPSQIELVENNHQELEKLGFSFAEFGGNSYVISAIPALAGKQSTQEIFLDTLAGFGETGKPRTPGGKLEDIISRLACRAAIKSGYNLSTQEIDALLTQMVQADLFSHCPHGRPVVKKFTPDEIEKWFSRT